MQATPTSTSFRVWTGHHLTWEIAEDVVKRGKIAQSYEPERSRATVNPQR